MLNFDFIKKDLENKIGLARYEHSIRVMETAKALAKNYNVDVEKCTIAALLHDCGRFKEKTDLLKWASEFDIIHKYDLNYNINLLHGPLGAEIANQWYKIEDIDILNAIRYHTTGREGMTSVEKIVYLADYIEPGRSFPKVDEVRSLSHENLDKSLMLAMNNTIIYLIEKGWEIDINTIMARNYICSYLNNKTE